MAIMQIKSGNKDLSFILQKNPASGMFMKSLKQGMLFAWFPKGSVQDYVIHFKDASDQITYKVHPDESFEYLNTSKYNDARFINDAIQEVMHAAREGKGDSLIYDIPCNHMITINLVNTDYKTIDIFRRYFPNIEMISTEVSKNNYKLVFTSQEKMRFQYFLQVINLFGIFAQLNSQTYSYLTEDLVKKYVRIANEIDAPYFIRYLIKMRMCRSLNVFNNVKAELEQSNLAKIEMQHGDTHQMRIDWMKTVLDDSLSIVDIGTGIDYRYLKSYAPKLQEKGLMYYAIEIDFDARERIKAGLKNRNLEDAVMLFESLDEFIVYNNEYLTKEKLNVMCTEVLEHNEFSVAKKIMKTVCKNVNFDNFVITLPNKNFNQFYGIEGFRHDDHKWEATGDDLTNLARACDSLVDCVLHNVGDKVDGIPVTYGMVITKMKPYATPEVEVSANIHDYLDEIDATPQTRQEVLAMIADIFGDMLPGAKVYSQPAQINANAVWNTSSSTQLQNIIKSNLSAKLTVKNNPNGEGIQWLTLVNHNVEK